MRVKARASRLGVAMPVDETVTMTSMSLPFSPASSSAAPAARSKRLTAAVV